MNTKKKKINVCYAVLTIFQKLVTIISKDSSCEMRGEDVKYLLQINTGSFTHTAAEGRAITKKLDQCLSMLDVDRVIYGWSPNREVNRHVTEYLDKQGIEKYLWLPIFCEIHAPESADPFVTITGEGNHAIDGICRGENFDFVCQSSSKNLERAMTVYDELTDRLRVEGVFIDRIRYASAANSVKDLYGCWCPRCRARYEQAGIDMDRIIHLGKMGEKNIFMPQTMEHSVYHYEDSDIDKLMRVKRTIISEATQKLCTHFRSMGKKVGIDTFAPSVADFVGQDLQMMGSVADFVKPMVYLKTNAPAGVPYEIQALGTEMAGRISKLGGDACSMDATIEQVRLLMASGINVTPGIDVNRIEPICEATPEYVKTYLNQLEEIGCQSVVLAWDAMRMSEDVLSAIAAR